MIENHKVLVASWTPRRIADLLNPPPENAAGSRFLPFPDSQRDRDWGLQGDKARQTAPKKLPLNLQVNADATNPALGGLNTHTKFAKFDHDLTKPRDKQSVLDILDNLKEDLLAEKKPELGSDTGNVGGSASESEGGKNKEEGEVEETVTHEWPVLEDHLLGDILVIHTTINGTSNSRIQCYHEH
ncbi:MAG: hypothetical protein Q9166_000219 [cf. Caloplaca sp. 2 TL-2023]